MMEQKLKNKLIKVRINIPTIDPNFNLENISTEASVASLQLNPKIIVTGTELEVSEDIANLWCNESYELPDGRIGIRNHLDVGVPNNYYKEMQDNDIPYSKKAEFIAKFSAEMDKATKIKITRATRI